MARSGSWSSTASRPSKRERIRLTANRAAVQGGQYTRQILLDAPLVPNRHCQFMGGREIGPMCGEPSIDGYSYCKEHFALCYTRYVPRKPRNEWR